MGGAGTCADGSPADVGVPDRDLQSQRMVPGGFVREPVGQ
jgi:hypothetical protein